MVWPGCDSRRSLLCERRREAEDLLLVRSKSPERSLSGSRRSLFLWFLARYLEQEAVWLEPESCVVVAVILREKFRFEKDLAAELDRLRMNVMHLTSRACAEADVFETHMLAHIFVRHERVVIAPGGGEVGDVQSDVIEHGSDDFGC